MKRSEQDHLLREILEEGDGTNFRDDSLARGLDLLRQRKRRQRRARAGAAAILTGLAIFAVVLHYVSRRSPEPLAVSLVPASGLATDKVKIITDEELFALFPNRDMALIGSPGHQQLVFLDHGHASEQP